MIALPPKPPRKPRETDIVKAIIVALGRMRGVRAVRNNVGATKNEATGSFVYYGLGEGSPDVVGIITYTVRLAPLRPIVFALAFAIEVKRPKCDGGKDPTPAQEAWARAARARGLPVGLCTSVDSACEYVQGIVDSLGGLGELL